MKFTWFFDFFRIYPAHYVNRELNRLNIELMDRSDAVKKITIDRDRLQAELMGKEASERKLLRVLDASVGDPAPTDEKERRAYVSRISEVADILRPKALNIIALMREELDQIFAHTPDGWTRQDYDNVLRGTSNFGKLFIDWIEQMQSEHSAYITPQENNK